MTQSAAELLTDASLLHTLRRIEIALHLRIRQIALHAVGRSSDLAHRRASAADALHILIGRIVLLLLLLLLVLLPLVPLLPLPVPLLGRPRLRLRLRLALVVLVVLLVLLVLR